MTIGWPVIPLGEVLTHRKEFITIDDLHAYQRPRVQLHARGVVQRDLVLGAQIKTKSQQAIRAGEFLVAEIDAKLGGFGIVPPELDGAIVSSHYFLFRIDEGRLYRQFLGWYVKTHAFRDQVEAQGSTNYASIRPTDILGYQLSLPPVSVQQRIVARLDALSASCEQARQTYEQAESASHRMLLSAFSQIAADAPCLPMTRIAPLIRRPVDLDPLAQYPELGLRSFGNGTFHKPSLSGLELGSKRIFQIEPGDLLFSNVFAWEGAIAIAQPQDAGRYGSHRFITCLPRSGIATAEYLRFYFLTKQGLSAIGEASPGGAGRNRTLGLAALEAIQVPLPSYEKQIWFNRLQAKSSQASLLRASCIARLDALLKSALDRAFRGDL